MGENQVENVANCESEKSIFWLLDHILTVNIKT